MGYPVRLDVSGPQYSGPMIIDCDTCTMRDIACQECVVTFLLLPRQEVSEATVEAIGLLSSRGIVPPMRFQSALQGQFPA